VFFFFFFILTVFFSLLRVFWTSREEARSAFLRIGFRSYSFIASWNSTTLLLFSFSAGLPGRLCSPARESLLLFSRKSRVLLIEYSVVFLRGRSISITAFGRPILSLPSPLQQMGSQSLSDLWRPANQGVRPLILFFIEPSSLLLKFP